MNRNLVLVSVSLFFWGLGEGFFIYFQPLYLQQWGADPVEIGAVLGGIGVALALSQIPTGLISDRFGPRVPMIASWVIGVIAAWGMVLAPSLPFFIGSYLIYGLTGSGLIPINAYITRTRGKLSVGRVLSLTSGLYSVGAIIGPILGGRIADRLGLHSIYVIAAWILILSTILILFVQSVPNTHPDDLTHPSQSAVGVFQNPRLLLFLGMTFVTMLALYLPQPLTSNFLQNQQHLSDSTIGLMGAIGSFGNAFAMLVLGNIAPFWGLVVGQLWAALFAAFFLWGNSPLWFGLGYFFFGGYRLCRSMTLAYARPLTRPEQTGLLFGALETANAVAVIVAPVLAGFLYSQDPYLIYRYALIAVLVILALNIILMKTYVRNPKMEKK